MTALKIIGAVVIIFACGSVGVRIRQTHTREIQSMKMLISALDYMKCELSYRMYPLPELCRLTAKECEGVLRKFFSNLANEMDDQISPDVKQCINTVLAQVPEMATSTAEAIILMGKSMGRFDLQGQLKGLESVRAECRLKLSKLMADREPRMRSYQTLGLCAGAAIVILLV